MCVLINHIKIQYHFLPMKACGCVSVKSLLLLAFFWLGDIQIGMVYRKERLDVEVIRARGLVGKQGNKNTPGDKAMHT